MRIAAGESSGETTFKLIPQQDDLYEGDETVVVSGTAAAGRTPSPATLTIIDDDKRVELSLDQGTLEENAGETTVTVTAKVFEPGSENVLDSFSGETVITLAVAGGTAQAKSDYITEAPSPFQITIPAGSSSATTTFKLTPKQDALLEGNETVEVSGITDAGWSPMPATLTIVNLCLSADCDDQIVEGDSGDGRTMHVLCTVTRHDDEGNPVISSESVEFDYRTIAGTATPGADYEERDGSRTVEAGQSSVNVALAVFDDDEEEVPDRFNVEFSTNPPISTVTVLIVDNDGGPTPQRISTTTEEELTDEEGPTDAYRATAAFGASAYSVTEGGPAATVAVKLDPVAPESRSIAVPITGTGGPEVTRDDWQIAVNAGAGDTWNAAAGTAVVQFALGETERTFTLKALDDDEFEGNERLSRAGALWDADLPDTRNDPGARMTAEVGYGLHTFSGVGLLTPWAGTELAEGEGRTWRAGLLSSSAGISPSASRVRTAQR